MPHKAEVTGQIEEGDFTRRVASIERALWFALRRAGRVLLIRPVWADGELDDHGVYQSGYTEWTHPFTDAIREKALDEGWDLTDLSGADATRANVEAAFEEGDFDLVIHCDHGGWFTLYCDEYEEGLDSDNIDLAAGSVLSTTSCKSAWGLGPVAIGEGVTAYLGYTQNQTIWTHQYVSMFTDAAYTAHMALLECKSVQQAFDACWAAYDTLYNDLLAMDDWTADNVAPSALHDRDCFTLLGSSSAVACPLDLHCAYGAPDMVEWHCALGGPDMVIHCRIGHPDMGVIRCTGGAPMIDFQCRIGHPDLAMHCVVGRPDMMLAQCAAGPNILDTCTAGPPLIFREIYEGYPVDLVVVDMDKIPEDIRKPFRQMIDKMRAEG